MPALELVLREMLRVILSPTALRRNFQDDLDIGGKRILKGNFVAYSLGDAHMNSHIYTFGAQQSTF